MLAIYSAAPLCCDSNDQFSTVVSFPNALRRRGAMLYNCLKAMPVTVLLKDIVDALEMQLDESSSFLDLDTGQVETVSHELLCEAEAADDEDPDLPVWQEPEWEIAKRIVSTDRFQKLPTKFDVHE